MTTLRPEPLPDAAYEQRRRAIAALPQAAQLEREPLAIRFRRAVAGALHLPRPRLEHFNRITLPIPFEGDTACYAERNIHGYWNVFLRKEDEMRGPRTTVLGTSLSLAAAYDTMVAAHPDGIRAKKYDPRHVVRLKRRFPLHFGG